MPKRFFPLAFAALATAAAGAVLGLSEPAVEPGPAMAPAGSAALAPGDSLLLAGAEVFDQIVYLPLRVNGAGPFPLVLDTGAGPITVLDAGLADSLGLAAEPMGESGGAGEESVPIGAIAGLDLALGPLGFAAHPVVSLPLHRLDPHWGKRKDGVIGSDILAQFVTSIDYERERVVLRAPGSAAGLPGLRVPVHFEQGFLFVQAELLLFGREDTLPALLMVDTGLRVTTLNRPFAEQHALAAQSPLRATGVTGFGIGGVSRGTFGRVRELRIGELIVDSPVLAFSQDSKGALASDGFAGILGADILSRYRVTLDYAGGQLLLAPTAGAAAPYEFDMSGLRFVMHGERFERLEVFFVFADSPAAEAGLMPGDRVTAIDGRPAASFTRETLRPYLQREGALVTLEIVRDGQPRTISLRLRRLV